MLENLDPRQLNRDKEEAKDLGERSRLFAEREELRKARKGGRISEDVFKTRDAELTEMIDSLGAR